MSKGTAIVVLMVVLGGGFLLGKAVTRSKDGSGGNTATASVAKPSAADSKNAVGIGDGVDRARVPLDGANKGSADAKVNIVAFSDFQCPFCSRVLPTMEKIEKEYGKQVRVWFRHNPLPFHQDAPLASEAAIAADAQGKFWPMHDKMFANQQNLKRPDLEKYAQEVGLDMGKFKEALDKGTGKARIATDMAVAKQINVQGTPNFYLNGRNIQGAQPFEEFKKVIDEEIGFANKLIAKGIAPGKVYATFMEKAKTSAAAPDAAKPQPPQKAPGAGNEVYKLALVDAPSKGAKQPKVTIVEFSEFQCPFCSRVNPTISEVLKTYGNDVQVQFRHNPLPFHNNAMIASIASEAAREQGKFWEMHDKLFANQQALERAEPREVRRGNRPQHGQVQGRAGQPKRARTASSATWMTPPSSARVARPTSSSTAATCVARSRSRRSRRPSTRRSRRRTPSWRRERRAGSSTPR